METNFNCLWQNRLDQFGYVDITLVITDTSGTIPQQWLNKSYHMASEDVNEAFLEQEAIAAVNNMVSDWNNKILADQLLLDQQLSGSLGLV